MPLDPTIDALVSAVEGEPTNMTYPGMQEVGVRAGEHSVQRPARSHGRVGILGLGDPVSIAAGATQVFTDVCQRAFEPERLILTVSQVGAVVTSIKIGDEEYIIGAKSVVAELFDKESLNELPDVFWPAGSGVTVSVTVKNTAGTATSVGVSWKGTVAA